MKTVLIRGGGDLASGIALRLHRCGFQVIITELPEPLAVRRAVSFCEAVYEGQWQVEEVTAKRVENEAEISTALEQNQIPVIIDPGLANLPTLRQALGSAFNLKPFDTASPVRAGPSTIIDARLTKHPPAPLTFTVPLHIGVGPGFIAGENCDAVIESQRGHTLGRVIWRGSGKADSGLPEGDPGRVLRAPADGTLIGCAQIGDHIEPGETIAEVDGQPIIAPFPGVLRGLIRPGIRVPKDMKVGDLDARDNREYCFLVSEKALAIGGGVLEAILTHQTKDQGR
jgi:xanthine dehydrogenase accessory factor